MSRAGRDRRAGALLAPRTETQRGRSMIELDYWAEAAAIKRTAGRFVGRRHAQCARGKLGTWCPLFKRLDLARDDARRAPAVRPGARPAPGADRELRLAAHTCVRVAVRHRGRAMSRAGRLSGRARWYRGALL